MTDGPPDDFGKIVPSRIGFGDKLSALCAMELSNAHGNPEAIAAMTERLTNSLAFTIAIAARGDPKAIQEYLDGVEAYLYATVTDHQRMGEFMAKRGRSKP